MARGVIMGRRLVLPASMGENDVVGFAQATNGQKIHDVTADPEFGMTREIIWLVAPGYFLHFGREKPFNHSFVQVSGENETVIENFTNVVSAYFETPSDDSLLEAIDTAKTAAETREALVMAGIGAPQSADGRYLERLEGAIHNQDPEIREAGLWCALHTSWSECQPLVQNMAASDPSDSLRQAAIGAMEHWHKKATAPAEDASASRCPFHRS
jgi:hypothetical protein